jgi:murein DD-endopeptidase MepM/ murein hydrolase activator NlpD
MRLSRLLGVLLALVAAFCFAAPAMARGLVVSAAPAGEAGRQMDAAVLSPQLPQPQATTSGWRTYTVQPGDTVSAIAERFGVEAALLTERNNLANPDRIVVGQVLRVEALPAPRSLLPTDGPLIRAQFWPWPPIQGQTLVLWLQTRTPVTGSLRLEDRTYPLMISGRHGWAMIPIPSLIAPGPKPLEITLGQTTVTMAVPVQAGVFSQHDIPASVSAPILSQADKVRDEAIRVAELFGGHSLLEWTPRHRFLSPLEGEYPRTSPFGSRRTYGGGSAVSAHAGEDYSAPPGTPVRAPAAGTAMLAELLFVRGNAVVLDHGRGVFTGYWHLSALHVKEGDRVEAGQLLGEVGSTGLSTGAHLHWELRVHGVAVDPLQWLES